MPCPDPPTTEPFDGTLIVDLNETHPFQVGTRFQPRDKAALVRDVKSATASRRGLRALGSIWSSSHVNVADDVLDTLYLGQHLSQPFPLLAPLSPTRLSPAGRPHLLADLIAGRQVTGHFIFVEGGIKICRLLADLKECGLSLPTMGAGGGQSIVGAFSTSTHGADFKILPPVDWIRALHLVGPAGREFWITPHDSPFATDAVRNMPGWPSDGTVVADDDVFDAVRVAVGRMGVIYSLILEVVPAYALLEVNLEDKWDKVREQLVAGDIRQAPLGNTEGGWFHDHVVTPIASTYGEWLKQARKDSSVRVAPSGVLRSDPGLLNSTPFFPLGLGQPTQQPSVPPGEVEVSAALEALGVTKLADTLRSQSAELLRYVNITVNLTAPSQCWVQRRWALPLGPNDVNLDIAAPTDRVLEALQNYKRDPAKVIAEISKRDFRPGELKECLGSLSFRHRNGRMEKDLVKALKDFRDTRLPGIAREIAAAGGTSGEALALVLFELAIHKMLRSETRERVLGNVSNILSEQAVGDDMVRFGHACDILDVHDYNYDHALSGNNVEFAFDGTGDGYLAFADSVLELVASAATTPRWGFPSGRGDPVFGYMAIRFTPPSSALLAMQRFKLTAMVEVATVRVRTEDIYSDFWQGVHAAARESGGIPHWGQEFHQSADEIKAHYGERLDRWRRVLTETIQDPGVFSTEQTRHLGLEPSVTHRTVDYDALAAFAIALETASD